MIFLIAKPMACNSSCIVFGEVFGEVPFITILYGLELLNLISYVVLCFLVNNLKFEVILEGGILKRFSIFILKSLKPLGWYLALRPLFSCVKSHSNWSHIIMGGTFCLAMDRNWVGQEEERMAKLWSRRRSCFSFDFRLEVMTVKWAITYYFIKVWRFRRSGC